MNDKKRHSYKEIIEKYKVYVPVVTEKIYSQSVDEKGIVTLAVENKGIMNFIAQKLLKKPRVSYIHLDEVGSFIWQTIDGNADIENIAERVSEHFKEKVNPLYERLLKFFEIVESYDFIRWKKPAE